MKNFEQSAFRALVTSIVLIGIGSVTIVDGNIGQNLMVRLLLAVGPLTVLAGLLRADMPFAKLHALSGFTLLAVVFPLPIMIEMIGENGIRLAMLVSLVLGATAFVKGKSPKMRTA